MYRVLSREPSEAGDGEDYEVVFRIPRTDTNGKPLKKEGPFVIAHPKLTTQSKQREQALAEDVDGSSALAGLNQELRDAQTVYKQVYISYDPEDEESKQVAQVVAGCVLKKYDVKYICFEPSEGVFLHQDFQKHVQESEFFIAVLSNGYLASLEANDRRPFKEAVAALHMMPNDNILAVKCVSGPSPPPAVLNALKPALLRRLFLRRVLELPKNIAHLEAFEEVILSALGVIPERKAYQSPVASRMWSWGLGFLAYPLVVQHGLRFPEQVLQLQDADLHALGATAKQCTALRAKIQESAEERPRIPEEKKNARALVDLMWSAARKDVPTREAVAEELREMSTSADGLEDIRTFAGLESLVKLVVEGSTKEKVAALWALRNFAIDESYRPKILATGILTTLSGLLKRKDADCLHAASNLLQILSTNQPESLAEIGRCEVIPLLLPLLALHHLPLKRAVLGVLANLAENDSNKVRIGRAGGVQRLVHAMRVDGARDMQCRDLALDAISSLVENDENRLKAWKGGGVDMMRSVVALNLPLASTVAKSALEVLLAGPRIHPNEAFRTGKGRGMTAAEMRMAILRLSQTESSQMMAKHAKSGFGLPHRPYTACAGTGRDDEKKNTEISRRDFEVRAQSSAPVLGRPVKTGLRISASATKASERTKLMKKKAGEELTPWEANALRTFPPDSPRSAWKKKHTPYTIKQHIPITTRMYVLDGPVISYHLRAFRQDPAFESFHRWNALPLPDFHPGMWGKTDFEGSASLESGPSSPMSHQPSGILKQPNTPTRKQRSILFADSTPAEDTEQIPAGASEESSGEGGLLLSGLFSKMSAKSRWKVVATVVKVATNRPAYRSVFGRSMTREQMELSVNRLSNPVQSPPRPRASSAQVPSHRKF